ncbi:ABC transporter-sugar transport%2C N-acetylneuraminate transport system permease [Streptococcus pneumoniae]|nr:ABC transporter-sugar transport%2C N-acetylneuraminate transport system permease [Streptococcus pneumoniae]
MPLIGWPFGVFLMKQFSENIPTATNYGLIMAGAALAAVPIVTVFLVFQKSFTQGITMGAVKG